MAGIQWGLDYYTGLPEVDRQHQWLFALINRLHEAKSKQPEMIDHAFAEHPERPGLPEFCVKFVVILLRTDQEILGAVVVSSSPMMDNLVRTQVSTEDFFGN